MEVDSKKLNEVVSNVIEAENLAEKIKNEYLEKAKELLQKGKEKRAELEEMYEKKAFEIKNQILNEGRLEIEKEVKKIIDDAKENAAKIKNKRLSKKDLEEISQYFFNSL